MEDEYGQNTLYRILNELFFLKKECRDITGATKCMAQERFNSVKDRDGDYPK